MWRGLIDFRVCALSPGGCTLRFAGSAHHEWNAYHPKRYFNHPVRARAHERIARVKCECKYEFSPQQWLARGAGLCAFERLNRYLFTKGVNIVTVRKRGAVVVDDGRVRREF